jgi:hypothetical protein
VASPERRMCGMACRHATSRRARIVGLRSRDIAVACVGAQGATRGKLYRAILNGAKSLASVTARSGHEQGCSPATLWLGDGTEGDDANDKPRRKGKRRGAPGWVARRRPGGAGSGVGAERCSARSAFAGTSASRCSGEAGHGCSTDDTHRLAQP